MFPKSFPKVLHEVKIAIAMVGICRVLVAVIIVVFFVRNHDLIPLLRYSARNIEIYQKFIPKELVTLMLLQL